MLCIFYRRLLSVLVWLCYVMFITAIGISRCFIATHFPHQIIGGSIAGQFYLSFQKLRIGLEHTVTIVMIDKYYKFPLQISLVSPPLIYNGDFLGMSKIFNMPINIGPKQRLVMHYPANYPKISRQFRALLDDRRAYVIQLWQDKKIVGRAVHNFNQAIPIFICVSHYPD